MLINTKLKIPSLRSDILYRKDLIKRLCGAEEYPFILLSGPAGSGKTSLICQWVMERCFAAVWYSLDQEDNEPDLFYRYLLASFIQADEGLKEPLGPMLGSQQQLVGDNVISLIIESVSDADRRFRLFLDDLHHIENEEILSALARLMKYMPATLQLVALSRYPLPPSMGSVALKKERLELFDSDLKFTEKETAALFKNVIPLPISAAQIRELNRYVEGWAAGLQLIGLEVKSKGDNFDLSSILNQASEQVAGYLIHDILGMLPEKIRSFVLATALLDRFNPEVCAEVTGQHDAARILARLERMNLFLIPLDGDGAWYRYHHMFSEAVRHQILIDHPDLITATLHQAALWFAASNHIEDAMRSAFRSGDFEFAADLLEDHIFQYILQLNPRTGLRWVDRLPSDILKPRILLRLQQCLILSVLMEFSKAKEVLASAESHSDWALQRYSEDKQALSKDYIIFLNGLLETFSADQSADIPKLLSRAKKISSKNRFLSTAVEFNTVFAYISTGDLAPAEASLARVTDAAASFDIMVKKIFFDKAKSLIARNRGRIHLAEEIIIQVQQELERQGLRDTPMVFYLHRPLGYIYYLQNRLSEARECADLAVRYCEYSGLVEEIMAGHELRLMLHLADGEYKQAAECFKRLRTYSLTFGLPQFSAGLEVLAVQMAVAQGNIAPAVLWSQRRKLRMDEPFSLLFVMECMTLARLYYSNARYAESLRLLETLRDQCAKKELMELVLYIDILRCINFDGMKRRNTARSILTQALAFSESGGYVRPFVNAADDIAPVLSDIAAERSGASFSSHLERVFNDCRIPLHRPASLNGGETILLEDLTKREIEILELMALGFLNKEIAQKAFISINTVKTHVRKILTKLGVGTRTQAIIKAKEMKII